VELLREAEALAEEIGPPGELWQIRASIGQLYERCGYVGEARKAYSQASQTPRGLAAKIKDEKSSGRVISRPLRCAACSATFCGAKECAPSQAEQCP
jgi:hypothetical protein